MGTPMQKELERPLFFSVAGILPGSLSGVALDELFRSDGSHALKNFPQKSPEAFFFVAQASKKDAKTPFY
ncbi:MAG: hypothetical protein IKD44_12665 [Lentisphaeria bacterium]|nr:hypothetical protein [Lentisphaeria bacterium]